MLWLVGSPPREPSCCGYGWVHNSFSAFPSASSWSANNRVRVTYISYQSPMICNFGTREVREAGWPGESDDLWLYISSLSTRRSLWIQRTVELSVRPAHYLRTKATAVRTTAITRPKSYYFHVRAVCEQSEDVRLALNPSVQYYIINRENLARKTFSNNDPKSLSSIKWEPDVE